MRRLLGIVGVVGVGAFVAAGCNAIFGIEVLGELPSGGGGGGQGGMTSNAGGAGATGGSGGNMGGAGGTGCTNPVAEICGDGIDQDCDGIPDSGCQDGTYVSVEVGDDNFPGTMEYPVRTIARGISNARALGGTQTVTVGEGKYFESVALEENISVSGGFQCNEDVCDWERNIHMFKSTIDAPTTTAVSGSGFVDRSVSLRGFHINGAGSVGSIATNTTVATVHLDGISPTIRECFVGGPSGVECNTFCTSAAVLVEGDAPDMAGPLLQDLVVTGGSAESATVGIRMVSVATVLGGQIKGGSGRYPSGISMHVESGQVSITKADIGGGTCTESNAVATGILVRTSAGAPAVHIAKNQINLSPSVNSTCPTCADNWSCGGISVEGGNANIVNNVVLGDPDANNAHAILLSDGEDNVAGSISVHSNTLFAGGDGGSALTAAIRLSLNGSNDLNLGSLRNNVLDGGNGVGRYGIYEDGDTGTTITPVLVDNNQFQETSVNWLRWNGTSNTSLLDLTDVNGQGTANNNVAETCVLDMAFRLPAGSDCLDHGTAEGAPTDDIDGEPRPAGDNYDIGADEAG